MLLSCPHCGFSKEVAPGLLPIDARWAQCPRCHKSFALRPVLATPPEPTTALAHEAPEDPGATPVGDVETAEAAAAALPKAGFWTRLVAFIIDAILVGTMQLLLGGILVLTGVTSSASAAENLAPLLTLLQLFTTALSVGYYVVFTGHCGQTPGKMAVRVKVIRRDGRPVSYGRAFFRELPGKFVSAILLGIGYLVVAFDEQKQGLHDRIADTYVIKL